MNRTIRGANVYNRVTPPGFPVVLGNRAGRRNILNYSKDLTRGEWSKTFVEVNPDFQMLAPDGLAPGFQFGSSGEIDSWHQVYQIGLSTEPGMHAWSAYFKKGEKRYGIINAYDGDSVQHCWFDLEGGMPGIVAPGFEGSMSNGGGGWWRCMVKGNVTNGGNAGISLEMSDTNGQITSLIPNGEGIYACWPQLEVGSKVTPYQATGAP